MADDFHKPTMFSGSKFESLHGADDPAETIRIAHETAHALLARVRADPDPGVVDRLVAFTDENGIDAIAELWSQSSPRSLPGTLWRIYLLRLVIRQDPETSSYLFRRGAELATTIDPVVAGAVMPTGPAEITELADRVLRGVFEGDFAIALERAAAFCRITATGCTSLADDLDATDSERSSELTKRALRFSQAAEELAGCARLWREDSLD
jgi:hypothetical protein